ncbi:MAG TPA: hypothetical protein VIS73_02180, partial [Rhodocyclaceae bacterium]
VGKVRDISLNDKDASETLIRIRVLKSVPITKKTRAQLAYQGVTGIAHILLIDDGKSQVPLVAANGSLPRIPMEASFFDRLGDAGGNVIQQSGELLVRAQSLLDEENQLAIRAILGNLQQLSGQLVELGERTVPLMTRVDAVLLETEALLAEENRLQLARSLDSFAVASEAATGVFERWQRLTDRYDALAVQLDEAARRATGPQGVGGAAARVQQLASELEQTSRRLNRVLGDIEDAPNSLIVGAPVTAPGPGEAGFRAPPVREK